MTMLIVSNYTDIGLQKYWQVNYLTTQFDLYNEWT